MVDVQWNNIDPRHDGVAYRCPTDLARSQAVPQKVLVIGQCTSDHIRLFLIEHGVECDFVHIQSMRDPSYRPPSAIETYDLQIVILPFDQVLPTKSYFASSHDEAAELERFHQSERALHNLLDVSMRWLDSHNILTFVGNFLVPQQNPLGRLLPKYEYRNPCYFVEKLNESLARRLEAISNAYLLDIDEISATFGRKYLQDDSVWAINHGGFFTDVEHQNFESQREDTARRLEPLGPVSAYYSVKTHEGYQALREEIISMYRIVRQTDAVKLVVIDLDDTAWRGVAAEEDLSHEFLTLGWPNGFIEALMYLQRRGILLAIISKNEQENAERAWNLAYGDHFPLSNFVSVKANWLPKHQNMQRILEETNLLAHNVVYIDDNPVERQNIESMFPSIRVIGSNPYYTRRMLLWGSETQVPYVSAESATRTQSVKSVIAREHERASMDHETFLASLGVSVVGNVIDNISDPRFKRSFELVNKTNQFNTTGVRYKLEDVSELIDRGMKIFSFEVKDRHTSYGIVCVAFLMENRISQFVMSCRVIGLGVEVAALSAICEYLRKNGFLVVLADSIQTDKNILSRDLYTKTGFVNDGGINSLALATPVTPPGHIALSAS